MSTPLSPATVRIILDYLCPLSGPLPAHLVSKPLLQRHHFLSLSPENATEYLAWPSSNPEERSHAVNLLQSEPVPIHDNFQVNYLPDRHDIQAHVRITPDLRLVFLFDKEQSQWLYHNVALMPFPANSYSSFDDAFKVYSAGDFLPEQNQAFNIREDDDDDSYWNGYGTEDNADHYRPSGSHLDTNSSSEDAYWARYSVIHGSADSTIPSPLPIKNTLPDEFLELGKSLPERVIVPSDDLQTNNVEIYNPLEPPPPASLARRLEALTAESQTNSPPLFNKDEYPTPADLHLVSKAAPESEDAVPALSCSSSTASPPVLQRSPDEFVVVHSATVPNAVETSVYPVAVPNPTESLILFPNAVLDNDMQNVLRDNIKSIYRLWKLGKQDTLLDTVQAKEMFIANVYQALEEL